MAQTYTCSSYIREFTHLHVCPYKLTIWCSYICGKLQAPCGTLNGVGCGTFYITNVDGYPVAKACITSHSSLPTPETTLYNQFNPYNFPVYSELINTRFQPHAVTHFITLNTALDIGYYRLVHTQFKATSKTYMFYIQKHKGKFGEESVLERKK